MATPVKKPSQTYEKVTFAATVAHRAGSIGLIAVVVILLAGYWLITPQYEAVVSSGQPALGAKIKEVAERQQYLDDVTVLLQKYRALNSENIDKLNHLLPTEQDIPGILVELQALTQQSGFAIATINIEDDQEVVTDRTATNGEIKKIALTLTLSGGQYQDFKKLLDAIEHNLRLFDVQAVFFAPEARTYSVKMLTYYFVPAHK